MLNIPQATTTSDAELASFIATIETLLEGLTGGPVVNRTITSERCEFTGWYTQLQVKQRPLVSVTSITTVQSGTVIDISAGLDINPAARTIRRKDGSPFPTDSNAVLVTYVAGWGTAVPAAVNTAARFILRYLWDSQRGAAGAPMLGGTDLVTMPGFVRDPLRRRPAAELARSTGCRSRTRCSPGEDLDDGPATSTGRAAAYFTRKRPGMRWPRMTARVRAGEVVTAPLVTRRRDGRPHHRVHRRRGLAGVTISGNVATAAATPTFVIGHDRQPRLRGALSSHHRGGELRRQEFITTSNPVSPAETGRRSTHRRRLPDQ